MGKKLFLETVGCQMNVLDSELVAATLRKAGYELVTDPKQADVILFNTCSVRQHAEDKIYSALGQLRRHKERFPHKIIGVLGCMAQKDQDLIRQRAPHVDIICGPGQLGKLLHLLEEVQRTRQPQIAVSLGRAEAHRPEVELSFESYDPLREPELRQNRFQAFVRTQFGCDKFCTYCIVPSVRGPEQSRHPDEIYAEVRYLVEQGCKEITLVGQTVNSYHYRLGDGRIFRLSDLLYRLHDLPGLRRIKFITNFPRDMTDDLLQAVRDLPKVGRYLHVPAQSGCDLVLRRMKRMYTVAFYRDMLQRCRETIPGVAISSDFIVGFCGETEESFQRTCDLVANAGFKNSYIFKYSPRPGTKAYELYPDDVPEEVKRRRNNDLLAIQARVSLADHRRFIGKIVEILVEGPSKWAYKLRERTSELVSVGHSSYGCCAEGEEWLQLTGRTDTDHIVVFDGPTRLIGEFVLVYIEDASPYTLFGQLVAASDGTKARHRLDLSAVYDSVNEFRPPSESWPPSTVSQGANGGNIGSLDKHGCGGSAEPSVSRRLPLPIVS
ncbi:MAG: tRNA (N6-isopentenyl adenosine(37)-C2)-methylthiotransferase MiaB [Gemmatales bacterium]|nr:tRNA (N6-isopentenyl adenosine(37)-C2)-methylthiotransferase MiaB [Gemmatales bacterium]MDW7995614.1 tRNA (N6-isopentenyl adenosine(37)-C2)-methylthiotransferase MiaB [Gemmatales bacterium]